MSETMWENVIAGLIVLLLWGAIVFIVAKSKNIQFKIILKLISRPIPFWIAPLILIIFTILNMWLSSLISLMLLLTTLFIASLVRNYGLKDSIDFENISYNRVISKEPIRLISSSSESVWGLFDDQRPIENGASRMFILRGNDFIEARKGKGFADSITVLHNRIILAVRTTDPKIKGQVWKCDGTDVHDWSTFGNKTLVSKLAGSSLNNLWALSLEQNKSDDNNYKVLKYNNGDFQQADGGGLVEISVGTDDSVFGINVNGQVYERKHLRIDMTPNVSQWNAKLEGHKYKKISVLNKDHYWLVSANEGILVQVKNGNAKSNPFKSKLRFKELSIASEHVLWAIDTDNNLHKFNI